jgi:excisionase family DNA binding protein
MARPKAQPDPLVISTQPAKDAWTVEETAFRISLGLTTTYALIKEGKIKVIRVGRAISVPQAEIDAFLAREAR